jgi:hypothetical protein
MEVSSYIIAHMLYQLLLCFLQTLITLLICVIAGIKIPGAGVVTPRADAHWIVTEYGAVDLYGKSLQERARLIISVAHPSAQEALDEAAFNRYGSHHHYIKGYMGK